MSLHGILNTGVSLGSCVKLFFQFFCCTLSGSPPHESCPWQCMCNLHIILSHCQTKGWKIDTISQFLFPVLFHWFSSLAHTQTIWFFESALLKTFLGMFSKLMKVWIIGISSYCRIIYDVDVLRWSSIRSNQCFGLTITLNCGLLQVQDGL